ncbi:hypothetical protein ACFYMI_26145 [Streptomyces collinus]|uniref:hypothetical protein n=1 Tax=Streptomyces collinus TaxID=42684 RepID=UPI003683C6C0
MDDPAQQRATAQFLRLLDRVRRRSAGFLDWRRADRPQEEYREPTEQEWRDFQQHFELRKVHPRQRGRLIEIIQNLRDRIFEARGNGWLGEVEGLHISFDAATAKLNSLKNTSADGRPQLVDLGMAVFTGNAPTLNSIRRTRTARLTTSHR